jgi:hypothetical protein
MTGPNDCFATWHPSVSSYLSTANSHHFSRNRYRLPGTGSASHVRVTLEKLVVSQRQRARLLSKPAPASLRDASLRQRIRRRSPVTRLDRQHHDFLDNLFSQSMIARDKCLSYTLVHSQFSIQNIDAYRFDRADLMGIRHDALLNEVLHGQYIAHVLDFSFCQRQANARAIFNAVFYHSIYHIRSLDRADWNQDCHFNLQLMR